MNATENTPRISPGRKVGVGCLGLTLLLVIGVFWRMRSQSIPDFPLPPPPPIPRPNAADTFAVAAQQFAKKGGTKAFLPAGKTISQVAVKTLRGAVQANSQALALFRQGLDQPCQYPVVRSLYDVSSLHSDELDLAKLVMAEGRVHEADKDWRSAAESYLNVYAFGTMLGARSSFFNGLVAMLLEGTALQPLDGLLNRCDPTTSTYVADRLQRLYSQRTPVAAMLAEEQTRNLAVLQDILRNDDRRKEPGMNTWDRLSWKFTTQLTRGDILTTAKRNGEALVAWARQPFYLRGPLPPRTEISDLTRLLAGRFFAEALPNYRNILSEADKQNAQAQLLILKARLRVYAAQHGGQYPETLTALGLPPEILADPFRNAPLVYTPPTTPDDKPAPFQLYSVGPDGKDDGGSANDLGVKGRVTP